MLSVATIRVLGLQTFISSNFGSIPYTWNRKTSRIRLTKSYAQFSYWLLAASFVFMYEIASTSKFVHHMIWDEQPLPPAQKLFHIFWIIYIPLGCLLDFNTMVYCKTFVVFINTFLFLDKNLSGKILKTIIMKIVLELNCARIC